MLDTSFANESCPVHNQSILSTLAQLSASQNALCPATGLEVFKSMLVSLRTAGALLMPCALFSLIADLR
jgi:hypothetical protein